MIKTVKILFFLFLTVNLHAQNSGWKNVLKHGARTDGEYLNTEVIRELIEAASQEGGGTLYFPPGDYLTGPIHLKSNITI